MLNNSECACFKFNEYIIQTVTNGLNYKTSQHKNILVKTVIGMKVTTCISRQCTLFVGRKTAIRVKHSEQNLLRCAIAKQTI